MEYQESLKKDEMQFMMKTLSEQTLLGKIQWTCTDYVPISLVYGIVDKSANYASMSQMFDAATKLKGHAVQVEIMEQIDLYSNKGDISGSVSFDSDQGLKNTNTVFHTIRIYMMIVMRKWYVYITGNFYPLPLQMR